MAKNKTNSMQDKVVSGLYLISIAFTLTILSQLAGNIIYSDERGNEQSESYEEKKLQTIIEAFNSKENDDEITKFLNDTFTSKGGINKISYDELKSYYHFNTLSENLPKKLYETIAGGKNKAENHHRFNNTSLSASFADVFMGFYMIVTLLVYSVGLVYESIQGKKKLYDSKSATFYANTFHGKFKNFINSNLMPSGFIDEKKDDSNFMRNMGTIKPETRLDIFNVVWVFVLQFLSFLIIFAPIGYLFVKKPNASEYAYIGLGCNIVYLTLVLIILKVNGSIKNIMDVIMNCKLKTYCLNFIIAMGIWYLLFTIVVKDRKIENSTGMGLALIFIIAVLSGDYLMSRSKK